jgi:hypothetical protein
MMKIKVLHLTFLILQINALIDQGQHPSIEEVKRRIKDGSVFTWLRDEFDADMSFEPEALSSILNQLDGIRGGYSGDEKRKWGIEKNGLCLLLAWVNELIQQDAVHQNRYVEFA